MLIYHILDRKILLLVLGTLLVSTSAFGFDWFKKGQELLGVTPTATLTKQEIGLGLKDALRVGTERVVGQVGVKDGFNADPQIHIPLPDNLNTARKLLNNVGMGSAFDNLELKLNRAAEDAAPEAKALFWNSIEQMTLEDIQGIYKGPDDAATRYFREKMSTPLGEKMQPIINRSLAEVGAIQAYDAAMGEYRNLPFVPDVKADLTTYVIDKGLQGIFFYLAREEAAIRQNPAKRTTDILKKVFATK